MSCIDDIRKGISEIVQGVEDFVCDKTGLACSEELTKNSETIDTVELEELPHVKLEELTAPKEPVVGCYIQMHQVGCYETFIQERKIDPKKLEEYKKKLDAETHKEHGEMLIMPKKRLMHVDPKLVQKYVDEILRTEKPKESNLPPRGCLPGTVAP
jgi:hypothetical protein